MHSMEPLLAIDGVAVACMPPFAIVICVIDLFQLLGASKYLGWL